MAEKGIKHDDGLETVARTDFPEVVPGQDFGYLTRRSSLQSPEAVTVDPYYRPQNEKVTGYFAPQTTVLDSWSDQQGPPRYNEDVQHTQNQPIQKKKTCGMSRRAFIWLVSAVILVIVVAAVIGGVVGSRDTSNNKDSSSPSSNNSNYSLPTIIAKDKTGLAMSSSGDTLYAYYINSGNSIVEIEYDNGAWQQSDADNASLPHTVIEHSNAAPGSPLAAISYTLQSSNSAMRSLFYFDNNGLLTTMNTTGNGSWLEPYNGIASTIASLPNAQSIAACVATDSSGLNGIRVYYGAALDAMDSGIPISTNGSAGSTEESGYIQEVGMDFGESDPLPIWHVWAGFNGSDGSSGVSCALNSGHNHLYFRNLSSAAIQQWTWDYTNPTSWSLGLASFSSQQIASGGNIAVATDGTTTDYIFYQKSGASAASMLFTGGSYSDGSSSINALAETHAGYPLAATWYSGSSASAVVMLQNTTVQADLVYSSVTRSGQTQEFHTNTTF